jgi:hypothetical protein
MSDAAAFARPAALLGVLVSSNEAPDMVELDSKDQLFSSALRLQPEKLLARLCARLGLPLPATPKRRGPWQELTRAVAAIFGWNLIPKALFSASDGRQAMKMEQWLQTAKFTNGEVDRVEAQLLAEQEAAEDESEREMDDEEDKEEELPPSKAMGTMKGVTLAHAAPAAAKNESERNDPTAAAAVALTASGEQRNEGDKLDKAVPAATVPVAQEEEMVVRDDAMAEWEGERDAAESALLVARCPAPAKEKEEEEGGGNEVKQDVAKSAVAAQAAAVAVADVERAHVLLDLRKWVYYGLGWVPLSNSLRVCRVIVDKSSRMEWRRGLQVSVKHPGAKEPHRGAIVAVGHCNDKPYIVMRTDMRFEQAPINKDVSLIAGVAEVAKEDVEKWWEQYENMHKADPVDDQLQEKVGKEASVTAPQRRLQPR